MGNAERTGTEQKKGESMKIDTAEKLAQLWYETSVRVDPPRNPTPWDQLIDGYKKQMIAVANDVFKEIVLGAFGEPTPDDERQVAMMITSNELNIRIDFGAKLKWLAMPKPEAINFAITVLQHCGVPVAVNVVAAPGVPPTEPPPEGKPV
jgi:hypothetical protein